MTNKHKEQKITDEMIKNNPYLGSTFREHLKEEMEKDEELKIFFEKKSFLKEISNTVSDIREKEGLTQKEVAEKSGLKQSAIARLESLKNTRLPSLDLLNKVARALGKEIAISFTDIKNHRRKRVG